MPCYTQNTAEIDLSKANPDVLKTALEKLGYRVEIKDGTLYAGKNHNTETINWTKGQAATITSRNNTDQLTKQIKQAYSAAAIEYAAKRNGWTIKQTSGNSYEVIRR